MTLSDDNPCDSILGCWASHLSYFPLAPPPVRCCLGPPLPQLMHGVSQSGGTAHQHHTSQKLMPSSRFESHKPRSRHALRRGQKRHDRRLQLQHKATNAAYEHLQTQWRWRVTHGQMCVLDGALQIDRHRSLVEGIH
jgi:hypothetical protein